MERNILLTIEYDGAEFYGWQRQPELRTVQGEIEKALSKVCATEIKIHGTSRTDAGVHALGQRASFKGDFGIPTDRIILAVNNMLMGENNSRTKISDVSIKKVEEVAEDFHARFDSKGKKYRYIIRNHDEIDVFKRNYCYQVRKPLNLEAMREASLDIIGKHDFVCFQAAGGTPRETTVRNVYSLDIFKDPDDNRNVFIEIAGDGFLYNMVRIIAGTLVDVGLGKKKPSDVKKIIEGRDRQKAGPTAPPEGLYLVEIYYDGLDERKFQEDGTRN